MTGHILFWIHLCCNDQNARPKTSQICICRSSALRDPGPDSSKRRWEHGNLHDGRTQTDGNPTVLQSHKPPTQQVDHKRWGPPALRKLHCRRIGGTNMQACQMPNTASPNNPLPSKQPSYTNLVTPGCQLDCLVFARTAGPKQ